MHKTSYKIEEGEFGGEECYRLTVDHGVHITFDKVSFYGGIVNLSREGNSKASIKEVRLPSSVKLELREIAQQAEQEEAEDE